MEERDLRRFILPAESRSPPVTAGGLTPTGGTVLPHDGIGRRWLTDTPVLQGSVIVLPSPTLSTGHGE